MPTNEELEAMMCMCVRITQILQGKEYNEKQLTKEMRIVWNYTDKVRSKKQINRERAKKWNKENYEKHKEHNKKYIENNKEKIKARQHEYYKQRKGN